MSAGAPAPARRAETAGGAPNTRHTRYKTVAIKLMKSDKDKFDETEQKLMSREVRTRA